MVFPPDLGRIERLEHRIGVHELDAHRALTVRARAILHGGGSPAGCRLPRAVRELQVARTQDPVMGASPHRASF